MLAFVTVFVGFVGAAITFMQWRTAQQKSVFDILEDRFEIYSELVDIVNTFGGSGRFDVALHKRFLDAQRRARFYFGSEVDEYLERLRLDMHRGGYIERVGLNPALSEDQYVAMMDRINGAHAELDKMFIPYMRVDQKMPRWPWQTG
jgi:hypothetical protein